jgi:hypothetical protein
VPYLPWAKIKGTRYHWDGKQGPDVKGTIFGVAVALYTPKTTALVLETFSMRILLDLSTGLRSVKLTIPVFLKGLLSILLDIND